MGGAGGGRGAAEARRGSARQAKLAAFLLGCVEGGAPTPSSSTKNSRSGGGTLAGLLPGALAEGARGTKPAPKPSVGAMLKKSVCDARARAPARRRRRRRRAARGVPRAASRRAAR